MKIYDLVKMLLERYPELRGNDKLLIWNVWGHKGYLINTDTGTGINKDFFMIATSTESIRRCRQKIQEKHPELRADKFIQDRRKEIENQRGTHIYREE